MKKKSAFLFLVIVAGLTLNSCKKDNSIVAGNNSHRSVEEAVTGMVVEQEEVSSFLQMVNNSGVPVVVIPDTSYNVVVQASSVEALSSISTDVSSGTLVINAPATTSATEATVFVYAPPVEMVTLGGNGTIEMQGTYQLLDVFINGSGSVTLSGSAQNLQVSGNGNGHLNALNLPSGNVAVNLKGNAVAKVAPQNNLQVNLGGNSKVFYTGSPIVTKTLKGNASIKTI